MDDDNLENCRFNDDGDFVCDNMKISAPVADSDNSTTIPSKELPSESTKPENLHDGAVL